MLCAALSMALFLQAANAPSELWKGVNPSPAPRLQRHAELSHEQENSIKATLAKSNHAWECATEGPAREWVDELSFSAIALSDDQTVLVEAGPGCARGGQGANGAMWVVRLKGTQVAVLASPEQAFNGWLYAIQRSSNKGYKDIVLGWHVSAREAGLSYFRFNGTKYARIGTADIRWDDSGNATITPVDKPAQR